MSYAEDVWAGQDAATSSRKLKLDLELIRTIDPVIQPVLASDVITALKLPSGQSETDIDLLIEAITLRLEKELNQGFIEQTWVQVQSHVGVAYSLFRRPVLSVDSVQYVATFSDDTLQTVSASNYILGTQKDQIRTRSVWPTHRGWKSWTTTFKLGYYNLPDTPDDDDKAAARAAVPENIRRAILQWIGHLYNNREGQGPELKYEVIAKRTGPIPANVAALVQIDIDRRFIIR